MQSYYFDTCIWLNLFKKEGDSSKGIPYWEIAEKFIINVLKSGEKEIIYSNIVLKEIEHKLNNPSLFKQRYTWIKKEKKFNFIELLSEDYDFARKMEFYYNFQIGFYDFLHIAVCKRLNLILITRDKDLIEIAKGIIEVKKPEELIN